MKGDKGLRMSTAITEKEVKEAIKGKLSRYFGVSPTEATEEQMYKAVVMSVRDILLEKRQQFHKRVKAKRAKRVYYLCMEFLLGRSLKNSLYNLSATDVYKKVVSSYGFDWATAASADLPLALWTLSQQAIILQWVSLSAMSSVFSSRR